MTTTMIKTFRTRPGKPETGVDPTAFRADRATVSAETVQVDQAGGRFEAGLIRSVSVISLGPALGHGLWIDQVAMDQVAELGSGLDKGLKSRFTHPGMSSDGTGKHLGRIHGIELNDSDQVIGDLHLAKSAHKTPDGNLAAYVMSLAEEDPAAAGLSIVFGRDPEMETDFLLAHGAVEAEDRYGPYLDLSEFKSPDPANTDNYPHVRVAELRAADVVDDPAANPDGLFDRQPMAREVDDLLSFAVGLTETTPRSDVLGIDATRAQQFLRRWMNDHGVQFKPEETPEMAQSNVQTIPTQTPSPEPGPTREELRAEFAADLKRYTTAFGSENGTKWFHEGVEFTEAQGQHIEALTAERDKLAEEVVQLKDRLANVELGETTAPDLATGGPETKVQMTDFFKMPNAAAEAN